MRSIGSAEFWRLYSALPPRIKTAARAAYRKFKRNPAHPGLSLERLRRSQRLWSVCITLDYRAVAARTEGDFWLWVWIGSHKDLERKFGP